MGSGVFRKCHYCTERFEVRRDWQIFCTDRCRKVWNYLEAGYCFYCGEPGQMTRDHLHPVAARSGPKRCFRGQETVPACAECNGTLGAKIFGNIEARITHLIESFIKKYKLDVGAVGWADEELDELGPSLRKRVKHLLLARHKSERRVLYMRAVLAAVNKETSNVGHTLHDL